MVSNDWGRTWHQVPTPLTFTLDGISCPSLSDCIAVGESAHLRAIALYSRNGGVTWHSGELPRTAVNLNAVACADATVCVASGPSAGGPTLILRTIDGGVRWTEASVWTTAYIHSLACPTISECLGVGVGVVARSLDGGKRWTVTPLALGLPLLLQVACPTAHRCLAVGSYQSLAYRGLRGGFGVTTNAGRTWTFRMGPLAGSKVSLAITCQRELCVAPAEDGSVLQVAVTTNGGRSWHRLAPTLTGNFAALTVALSRDSAYLLGLTLTHSGNRGFILRSTSGA